MLNDFGVLIIKKKSIFLIKKKKKRERERERDRVNISP